MAKANPTDKQLKELTDPSHQIPPGANLKKFKALQAKLLDTAKAVREALPDEPGTAGPLYGRIQAAATEAARVFEKRAGVEASPGKQAVLRMPKITPTPVKDPPPAPVVVGPVKVAADGSGEPVLGPTNTPHPSAAPAGSTIPPDSDGRK